MRERTADENTVLASRERIVTGYVEIQNASGTWKNYAALTRDGFFSDLDFFVGAEWGTDIDAPTWTGQITLAPSLVTNVATGESVSISPYIEDSPANVDDLGAHAPAVEGMRRVRVFATTSLLDGTLASTKKVFDGYVVEVEHGAELVLTVSDLGHRLVIAQIEDERVYKKGVLLETAIQQMIDHALGAETVPLVVDPGIAGLVELSSDFKQDRVRLMEAIRTLAFKTVGANVRYMWNAAGEMELRLFMPPRVKSVADFTFDKNLMEPNVGFREKTDDVRNAGRLYYQDSDKKAVVFVPLEVQGSIDKYKRRYFEFREDAVSEINTRDEALAFLTDAISDLSTPKAEKQYTSPFNWASDVWDLYTLTANEIHYSTDQQFATTRVANTLGAGVATTRYDVRGTLAGYVRRWIAVEGEGPRPPNEDTLLAADAANGEATMYGGELFAGKEGPVTNGCVWLYLKIGASIRRVHIWARQNSPDNAVVLWPPTSSLMYKAVTIERPEGRIPREGNFTYGPGPLEGRTVWSIVVPIPTNENHTRTLIVQAEDFDGNFGAQQRFSVVAEDFAAPEPGELTDISITRIDATTVRVAYTPATAGATLFFRDGIMIDSQQDPPGATPQEWLDEELHPDKQYKYQVVRIDSGRSGPRTIVFVPAWTTTLAFANATPAYDETSGAPRVRIEVSGAPVGTVSVRVEKSRDVGHYEPWTEAITLPIASFPFYDVVVVAGQGYRLVALDVNGDVLDTSQPAYWTNPL